MQTSNEELQAANEELVASNEELQSTNEELETAKEGLVRKTGRARPRVVAISAAILLLLIAVSAAFAKAIFAGSAMSWGQGASG